MVSRKGLKEPGWWERWADLLYHWWWSVVCDHCVSLGTGLTDLNFSLPSSKANFAFIEILSRNVCAG